MSWAEERRLPNSAYLLCDAQPPRLIPYTPREVNARSTRMPASGSAMLNGMTQGPTDTGGPTGITAYAARAVNRLRAGAP